MAVMGKAAAMRQFSRHRRPQGQTPRGQGVRFWGRHAVLAALANPERRVKRIWGTREALGQLDLPPVVPISFADVADLARLVARDAPHQGLVIEVDPLDEIYLGDLLQDEVDAESKRPIVVLDQVTDPHNIGATQDRHSPPESGVIARSASGALETVPWVRVVNLSRALEEIAEAQYWRIGLTGDTETTLGDTLDGSKVAPTRSRRLEPEPISSHPGEGRGLNFALQLNRRDPGLRRDDG